MTTIRRRVLLASTITAAAALAVASVAIYLLVRVSMLNELDAGLSARARMLAALVEVDDQTGEFEFQAAEANPDDAAFQILSPGGLVIERQGDPLLLAPFATAKAPGARPEHRTLADRRRVRVAAVPCLAAREGRSSSAARDIVVEVARDTREFDRSLWRLAMVLIGVATGVSIMSGWALSVALKSALRPLATLASDIARLETGSLDHRISGSSVPGELTPIVHRLNDLLARIERDVQKEKSFNAAIAHELRTPLGGLRSTLEVNLGRDGGVADHRRALQTCHGICMDMQVMVERLLMLAKVEAGQIRATVIDTDLSAIVRECWSAAEAKARLRGMRMEPSWIGPVVASSDPALVRIIVSNLIDNALSHGTQGGVVTIDVASRDGRATLRVANPASGLTEEQGERAFDRFWRADEARSNTGEHYGLGMPLCRDLVTILGGTIAARCDAGSFVVEVALPSGH